MTARPFLPPIRELPAPGCHFLHADPALPRRIVIGWERQTRPSYSWRGLERPDGPLCIFQFTLHGCGVLERGGVRYELPPGTGFLVAVPDDHHYYLPAGWDPWEFCYILFDGEDVLRHIRWVIANRGPQVALPLEHPVLRHLADMAWAIHGGQYTEVESAAAALYRLVMHFRRLVEHPPTAPTPPIVQAVQFAAQCFSAEIDIDDLAAAAGLSRAHFSRRFRTEIGISPLQYLTEVRLRRAMSLLRGTILPLEEVADQCGFAGASYFGKVFRKTLGITPADYRRGVEAVLEQRRVG